MTEKYQTRVAVIGAGPAGIAAGRELLSKGFSELTIFEKADAAGGTWHLHSYPGLACDLWAHSYTFSYRPNPDWSANFVGHAEIERYLQDCAEEFGLTPHFAFNTKIVSASFQADKTWTLIDDAGSAYTADVIINCMGGQHTPIYPEVEGIEDFSGPWWHSTNWNHGVDLSGKRVAIVGSAAAAVQIVPEVARTAGHLTVLQRTPNWIMPRNWKRYSPGLKFWFRHLPPLLKFWRWGQLLLMGTVLEGVTLGHKRMEQFEGRVHKFIAESIDDPELRKAVTPQDHYGCKRGLVSDDFYPALNRDNVELIPEGLKAVRPAGITTTSGTEIDVDVIVYCTGYKVLDFDRIEVNGVGGKNLGEVMSLAPEAYAGIAAPDFPNYFFGAGPNGLPINTSYFTTVEQNVETVVRLMVVKERQGVSAVAVKQDVADKYNDDLKPKFETYSWGAASCHSYYRTETGHAPFLFPGGFKEYQRIHQHCSLSDFEAV